MANNLGPVRVAMVCPYDWSTPGGVQAQVEGLASALQRTGVSVVVVAPATEPADVRPDYGFDFVGVGKSMSIAANGSRAPVAPTPAAVARTIRVLRRLRPDVVHVHEPFVPGPSLAALAAGPRPILGTFHRSGWDALYKAEGLALRGLAHRLNAAVAVSEAARETAAEVLGRELGAMPVIPNGVDLHQYAPGLLRLNGAGPGTYSPRTSTPSAASSGTATSGTAASGTGGQSLSEPLTIVFVGRHEERKGLVVLLEAFDRLRNDATTPELSHVRLDVVGEGPATSQLKQRFGGSESVRWLGAVDDVEKARRLAAADVFVAPSLRGESFGVVLLEAMAAGTSVIASDLPGYRLAAGEAARFVPPGDAPALASALEGVLRDPDERERLRALATERVRDYSFETVVTRYVELYESLVGE